MLASRWAVAAGLMLVLTAAGVVDSGTASAAHATSFNGSCRLVGGLLTPASGSGGGSSALDFIGSAGTCTGSLNGSPPATYKVRSGWSTTGLIIDGLLPLASGNGSIQFGSDQSSPVLGFEVDWVLTATKLTGSSGAAVGLASSWGTGTRSITFNVKTFGTITSR